MAAPTVQAGYAGTHGSAPPPPPLTMAGGPPQQGPSVLQILAMGQERNHAADAMAHHPRIESLVKLGKEAEATWLQIGSFPMFPRYPEKLPSFLLACSLDPSRVD